MFDTKYSWKKERPEEYIPEHSDPNKQFRDDPPTHQQCLWERHIEEAEKRGEKPPHMALLYCGCPKCQRISM